MHRRFCPPFTSRDPRPTPLQAVPPSAFPPSTPAARPGPPGGRDCAALARDPLPRKACAAICTETVQGTPWHRSRYPKQTVAYNIQGTPNLYVDGTSCFLVQGLVPTSRFITLKPSCFAFNSATVNYLNSETAKPDKEEETLLSKIKFWEKTDTEEKPTEDFDRYKSYMKGFLTAYNIFTENTFSITGVMKEKDVVEWLNDYCKENPMSSVENALTSFALDHHDGRMKTSARRGGR